VKTLIAAAIVLNTPAGLATAELAVLAAAMALAAVSFLMHHLVPRSPKWEFLRQLLSAAGETRAPGSFPMAA
jgi:hypothetical protein